MSQTLYAAQDLARELQAAEEAINGALVRVSALLGKMPETWERANLSVVVGMGAFDRAGALAGIMTQARREVGEMHKLLDAVRDRLHLPEMSFGDKMPGIAAEPGNVVPIAA